MMQWGDLFTARQKAVLVELGISIHNKAGAILYSLLACAVIAFR